MTRRLGSRRTVHLDGGAQAVGVDRAFQRKGELQLVGVGRAVRVQPVYTTRAGAV